MLRVVMCQCVRLLPVSIRAQLVASTKCELIAAIDANQEKVVLTSQTAAMSRQIEQLQTNVSVPPPPPLRGCVWFGHTPLCCARARFQLKKATTQLSARETEVSTLKRSLEEVESRAVDLVVRVKALEADGEQARANHAAVVEEARCVSRVARLCACVGPRVSTSVLLWCPRRRASESTEVRVRTHFESLIVSSREEAQTAKEGQAIAVAAMQVAEAAVEGKRETIGVLEAQLVAAEVRFTALSVRVGVFGACDSFMPHTLHLCVCVCAFPAGIC